MRSRTRLRLVALIVALVVAVAVAAVSYASSQMQGFAADGSVVEVVVPAGSTAGDVGELLADKGVIRNALMFRLMARSSGFADEVQAGTYELQGGLSIDAAIESLREGPRARETVSFTVPEGLTVAQTLERVSDKTAVGAGDLEQVLAQQKAGGETLQVPGWVPDPSAFSDGVRSPFEGLLFPATYEVYPDETAAEIVQRMVNRVDAAMKKVPADRVAALADQGLDRYEAAVIASLIERESKVAAEQPLISSVIHNRLEAGIPLQIDATVLYALGEHRGVVTYADLEVDSPYNTYRRPSLPPTPISGFGDAALQAAFAPAESDYLFYVLSAACDGSHVFSETASQHEAAKADYIAAGRCQGGD